MATEGELHNAQQEDAGHTCPSKAFPVQKGWHQPQDEEILGIKGMLRKG